MAQERQTRGNEEHEGERRHDGVRKQNGTKKETRLKGSYNIYKHRHTDGEDTRGKY